MTRARVQKAHYAPRVAPAFDPATRERVCRWCGGDLSAAHRMARFCSHGHRSLYHAQRRRHPDVLSPWEADYAAGYQ